MRQMNFLCGRNILLTQVVGKGTPTQFPAKPFKTFTCAKLYAIYIYIYTHAARSTLNSNLFKQVPGDRHPREFRSVFRKKFVL